MGNKKGDGEYDADSLHSQTVPGASTEGDEVPVHEAFVVAKPSIGDELKWLLVDGRISVH